MTNSLIDELDDNPTTICPCCGSRAGTSFTPVLWQGLGDEWKLSEEEYRYIDHQQGETCVRCGSNLRSQALALTVLQTFGHRGSFRNFARSIRGRLLRILEINEAGHLTRFFPRRCRHELRLYPDIDMMRMANVRTGRYDLVIHSDTLEHVPDPVKGLAEWVVSEKCVD